jgi:predicted peptidase
MTFNHRHAEAQGNRNGLPKPSFGALKFVKPLVFFSLCLCALVAAPVQSQTNSQNSALLAFKREQVAMIQAEMVGQSYYRMEDLTEALAKTRARISEIEAATGDAAQTKFSLHERAYFAPDGSAQPYWVALPKGYTPGRKWPLVVYLHGYTSDISKLNPWFPPTEIIEAASNRGFIMAIPYGRRNSDFVQWGQDDTLQVKRETMANYSVDGSRTFLAGASMGGYGVYAVALHDPSQWAAAAAICGRTDFYLWFGIKREELPAWKRALYDADDPRFLITNSRGTRFFVQHGARDLTVPVEHSRLFAADAKKLDLPVQYLEQPEGDHWFNFQTSAVSRAMEWFAGLPSYIPPRKIEMVAVDPREAKNGWASIEAFETYGEKASLNAQVGADKVTVITQNVARFALEPPVRYLRAGQLLTLTVNGVESPKLYDPLRPIVWQKEGAKVTKTPLRSGPFKSAFRDAFLLVYGNADDQKAAQRMAIEWKDNADGDAPIKAATEITEADKAKYNLILLGTAATNPLLAEIAPKLPVELTATGYRIGTEEVPAQGLGLRMVWKSPWNDKRLIGICSGLWWGEKLPVNHKLDLIPDYIVYAKETDADDTNHAIRAGFFDGDFELQKEN